VRLWLHTAAAAAAAASNGSCLIAQVLRLCNSAARQLSTAALPAEGSVRQQQLFSLVLSCSKLAAVRLHSRQPDSDSLLAQVAWSAVLTGVQLSSNNADGSSSSRGGGNSSSSSSSNGEAGGGSSGGGGGGEATAAQLEAGYMSLVLAARGFLLAGQVLQATDLDQRITTAELSELLRGCG
jgi:uncharacterized membrane protein YgcG